MPAKTSPPPEPDPVPATTTEPEAAPAPGPNFRFTGLLPTQYLHVPLTARPRVNAVPAGDDAPGSPERPATVFAWPDGPPDNRWEPTDLPPNQLPDNEPADTPREG